MPQAVAVLWEMVHNDEPSSLKSSAILKMDKILGLGLEDYLGKQLEMPANVQKILEERENARKSGDFKKSDELRHEIKKLGFEVEDTPQGPRPKKL